MHFHSHLRKTQLDETGIIHYLKAGLQAVLQSFMICVMLMVTHSARIEDWGQIIWGNSVALGILHCALAF